MLDSEKLKAKKRKIPANDDGANSEVLSLLQAISKKQEEQDERLVDLEEGTRQGAAALRMVNLTYDTDDDHLPGLTRIPLRAARPFALAMTLDDLTDPDVLSGKVSLQHRFHRHYFHLMRSVGGEHLKRGVELAGEQASSEAEKGAEMDLGGKE